MLSEMRRKQLKKQWKEYEGVVGWVEDEIVMFDVEEEDVEDVVQAMQGMIEFLFVKRNGGL